MGRPQKPFVVEVKRGRRGGVATLPTAMPKPSEPAPEAAAERRLAPPREPPKPHRRILDAIEPEPAPVSQLASEPADTVAADPLKRKRGRPPKAAGVPTQATKRPAVARRAQAPVVPVVRRDFQPVPDVHVAPLPEAKTTVRANGHADGHADGHMMTHGHMTHGDRMEAANALPRGERWKRRLPRVLW